MLSEARHIVAVAYFAILLSQPALVSEGPSHADGAPDLGIYSEDSFQPVIVALHAFGSVRYIATPYWVLDRRRGDIVFEGGKTVAETTEQTVIVVLVLQQVPVYTDAGIGSAGLVIDLRTLVAGISLAISQLEDRIVLVLEIDTERSFVLTVIADHQLNRSDDIYSHSHSTEERDGILFHSSHLLLVLCIRRSASQHQKTSQKESSFLYGFCHLHRSCFGYPHGCCLSGDCRNRYRNALWMHHNLPLYC